MMNAAGTGFDRKGPVVESTEVGADGKARLRLPPVVDDGDVELPRCLGFQEETLSFCLAQWHTHLVRTIKNLTLATSLYG